jgi:hypothetical protein
MRERKRLYRLKLIDGPLLYKLSSQKYFTPTNFNNKYTKKLQLEP